MDFYILKKQDKLVAIPADEQNCKQYLEDGYFYVDKVAACNEKSALDASPTAWVDISASIGTSHT